MEVMLIPRHLIAAVEGLQRTGTGSKPLYALDDDVSSTDEDDTRTELGGDNQPQRRREP